MLCPEPFLHQHCRDQRNERRGWKHRKWKRPPYNLGELKHAFTLKKARLATTRIKDDENYRGKGYVRLNG